MGFLPGALLASNTDPSGKNLLARTETDMNQVRKRPRRAQNTVRWDRKHNPIKLHLLVEPVMCSCTPPIVTWSYK